MRQNFPPKFYHLCNQQSHEPEENITHERVLSVALLWVTKRLQTPVSFTRNEEMSEKLPNEHGASPVAQEVKKIIRFFLLF